MKVKKKTISVRNRAQGKNIHGRRKIRNEIPEDAKLLVLPEDGEPMLVDPEDYLEMSVEPVEETLPEQFDSVELTIYGDIGCELNTAQAVIESLQWMGDEADVLVAINSNGGDVFEAVAIYNALVRRSGHVTVRIDGIAASAASLIVMAGDTVIMPENAMMMIHSVTNEMIGEADELRRAADMMDGMTDSIVEAYCVKSGLSEEQVRGMMNMETWLTAEQAYELGFVDVIENAVSIEAYRGSKMINKFRNVPAKLKAQFLGGTRNSRRSIAAPISTRHAATRNSHVQRVPGNIASARQISSLCTAAGVPQLTNQYVSSGRSVDDVRNELMGNRKYGASGSINNRVRPGSAKPPAVQLNTAAIYNKRRVKKGRLTGLF